MGNRGDCDARHNGLAKTDTKPDGEGFSSLVTMNNRLFSIFS
jgi:hypothetical protein